MTKIGIKRRPGGNGKEGKMAKPDPKAQEMFDDFKAVVQRHFSNIELQEVVFEPIFDRMQLIFRRTPEGGPK